MSRARILAFAQLLRIPNVFTAFADIALGACVAIAVLHSAPFAFWGSYLLVALASGCLYLTGMVWNDIFDFAEDAEARPFRPLPSGRVGKGTAIILGVFLFLAGVAFAALAGLSGQSEWNYEPFLYAVGIAVAVLVYDGIAKRIALIAPIAMGSCRFLNVLFGLSLIPEPAFPYPYRLLLASVVGVYIVGVTWFARTEEKQSRKWVLILAALVIVVSLLTAFFLRAALNAATDAAKPLTALGTFAFPYLLVGFGFLIGIPVVRAIGDPSSRNVQAAVKRCVLGLVVLDAVLSTAFVGLPGLLVVLLLPPALLLGKWVYST